MNNMDSLATISEPQIVFECGDATTALHKLSDLEFDLIITSPPYNIGKEYEVKKPIAST